MIKDDAYKPSVFKAPPENLDAAHERLQMIYDEGNDFATALESTQVPPEEQEEAVRRLHAAGVHPTNLIETVWKNADQFCAALAEIGWSAELHCHQKAMDSGRYRVLLCVAKADRQNKVLFLLWDKPHHLVVLTASRLSASESAQKELERFSQVLDGHTEVI